MIIPIRTLGDPVLKTPAKPVERFDDALRRLSENMLETMYDAPGVGLAGPQVGISLRLFVFDDGATGPMFVANPELLFPELEILEEEGCLSFPGAFVDCARPDYAEVAGTSLTGEPVHFVGTGLLARCLQHEADHTVGTVFGDRISDRNRKRLTQEHDSLADEFPADWPASTPVVAGPDKTRLLDPTRGDITGDRSGGAHVE